MKYSRIVTFLSRSWWLILYRRLAKYFFFQYVERQSHLLLPFLRIFKNTKMKYWMIFFSFWMSRGFINLETSLLCTFSTLLKNVKLFCCFSLGMIYGTILNLSKKTHYKYLNLYKVIRNSRNVPLLRERARPLWLWKSWSSSGLYIDFRIIFYFYKTL